jgi:hypothetical protein
MPDEFDNRTSAARAAVRIGYLPCMLDTSNCIVRGFRRSGENKPAQGSDKKSHLHHRPNPQSVYQDIKLFAVNEQYIEHEGRI